METNKTKRTLEIITTLVAIVYCGIDLLINFIGLIDIIKLANSYYYDIEASIIIGIIIGLALVIAELVVAIMLLRNILSAYNSEETTNKLRSGFTVLSFVVLLFLLLGLIMGNTSVLGIIGFILFIGVVIIECLVYTMKDSYNNTPAVVNNTKNVYNQYNRANELRNKVNNTATKESNSEQSFESKVSELRHLLSLRVITEEQFENAVNELTRDIINK